MEQSFAAFQEDRGKQPEPGPAPSHHAVDIGLILRHAQFILSHERYRNCLIPDAYLAAIGLPESGPIPLGVLLRLWEAGAWADRCSICAGWIYIIGASHDACSQSGRWWGLCPCCNNSSVNAAAVLQHGSHKPFLQDLYEPAQKFLSDYVYAPCSLLAYRQRGTVPPLPLPEVFSELMNILRKREEDV